MGIRQILQLRENEFFGIDTSLRLPCEPVQSFDEALLELVEDIEDTLRSSNIAVGLAAPQIGIRLRITVVNVSKDKAEDSLVLVNPRIVHVEGEEQLKHESCMSLPYVKGLVPRQSKIVVEYQDVKGQSHEIHAKGFFARVLMHEIDHLDGILFVDRMNKDAPLESTDLFDAEYPRELPGV